MTGDNTYTRDLALYLVALALLQGNDKTYVNKEINKVREKIEKELGL